MTCLLLLQLKNNRLNLSFKPQPFFFLGQAAEDMSQINKCNATLQLEQNICHMNTHTDLKSSHRAEPSQQLAVCLLTTSIQNIQYLKYCILCLQVQLDDQFTAIFKTSTAKPIMCAPVCFL